jgi:benzoyl-CoA reductase/2-hydroxyglutaryl-CoA dehydratase subunit BcrC/BadD/HgdB
MLRNEGVQVLQLEMSMDDILNLDAYRTRIEAFSEMLCQGRQCKEA